MSISNPSGDPNRWQPQPMTAMEMSNAITQLRAKLTWVIVLLVINVLLTGYVADFVHTILSDIHSI